MLTILRCRRSNAAMGKLLHGWSGATGFTNQLDLPSRRHADAMRPDGLFPREVLNRRGRNSRAMPSQLWFGTFYIRLG
jgi:hypothetical protein